MTSEAKLWLNELFGRKRAWSEEEDDLLAKLLPISRDDQELIQWGYLLRQDSEGWALVNGERRSKPKQGLVVLLREFSSEIDKWRTVRGHSHPPKRESPRENWPAGAKDAAVQLYGESVPLPTRYDQLSGSIQREIADFLAAKEKAA
jgi:hypothetical protein